MEARETTFVPPDDCRYGGKEASTLTYKELSKYFILQAETRNCVPVTVTVCVIAPFASICYMMHVLGQHRLDRRTRTVISSVVTRKSVPDTYAY